MTAQNGKQETVLDYSVGQHSVSFELAENSYPLEAICGAAYLLVDRCFVYL